MKRTHFIHLLFGILSAVSIYFLKDKISSHEKTTDSALLYAPPSDAKRFSFGYDDVLADLFWIRVLQDFDFCEQKMAPKGQSRVAIDRIHDCSKGWVYRMLDIVFETAPRWRLPAAVGPLMLSIVVDDINGATELFLKAVKNFPEDWPIHFRAAYHFLYEVDDKLIAAKMYERAGQLGAPPWVHSLAAKLYSEQGRDFLARIILKDAIARTPEGPALGKMKKRLMEIEERIKSYEKND